MYSDGRRFHFVWTAGAFLGEHFQTSSSNIFIPSSLCLSWPLSCTLESFHGLLMQSKLALDSWLCSHILLYSTTEHFGRLYAAHFSSCAPMISIRSHRLLTILAYYNNHFLHFFSVNSCETHKPRYLLWLSGWKESSLCHTRLTFLSTLRPLPFPMLLLWEDVIVACDGVILCKIGQKALYNYIIVTTMTTSAITE